MATLLAWKTTTPAGPLSLLARDGTLVACGFTDDIDGLRRRLAPAYRAASCSAVPGVPAVTAAFEAYFDGDVAALDALDVEQPGTPFQERAWDVMRRVPAGQTVTYRELAARAGNPTAARAAGSVCATNRLAPVVPCHRVVPTSGGLGNYGYGVGVKRWLLEHERRHTTPSLPFGVTA